MVGYRRRGATVALILMVGMLLAACGPLGDDDSEPTSTADSLAQPTSEPETDETTGDETPGSDEADGSGEAADPPAGPGSFPGASPVPVEPGITGPADVGTPVLDAGAPPSASPVATGPFATPMASEEVYTGEGDGTSGAMPGPTPTTAGSMLVPEDQDADTASPVASPVADGLLSDLPALTVASCEPEVVPQIALANVDYITVEDVNIRFGPGVDCDQLPVSPIGDFMPVTIIGGPVSREGEDFDWVQVTTSAGETGWVITTVLEPAT